LSDPHNPASGTSSDPCSHGTTDFEAIDLLAGIPKTGDANEGLISQMQQRTLRKGEQVDAARGDVLA
jgi:hypothetical protein